MTASAGARTRSWRCATSTRRDGAVLPSEMTRTCGCRFVIAVSGARAIPSPTLTMACNSQ